MENRFPEQIIAQLARLGHHIHTLGPWESAMGHAQAIALDTENQLFAGAADPRCDGLAMGY
jgi:gamma-glutamyltranspeptidase